MQLNYNCVRDLLLSIESFPNYSTDPQGNISQSVMPFRYFKDQLTAYDPATIAYTISKCLEADLISAKVVWANANFDCYVFELTFSGHEFLEKIRPIPVWKKTLMIAGEIGSKSIGILSKTAETLLTDKLGELLKP